MSTSFANFDYDSKLKELKNEFDEFYAKGGNPLVKNGDPKNFKFLTVLGQGAFGVVKLAKHESTGQYSAVKILKKENIIKHKHLNHVINEKKILSSINYPLVIRLIFTMKDNSNIYLGLEFINGGEMFTILRKMKKFKEETSRFYASQVVLAIEYIHKLELIYRDLKPENILVDRNGYIKITDFGFCKLVKERTYTFCGTPEYLAPEIINMKGYGKTVDWWSLGILIYEFSAGFSPFSQSNGDQLKMMERIVKRNFKFPSSFSEDLKNLISNLLQTDLSRRFGNLKNGVNDIKSHAWFKPINWVSMYLQKSEAPYIPTVTSDPSDVSQFDSFEDVKIKVSVNNKYVDEFADF